MNTRILDWEGCNNVRDLGGIRTGDGRATRLREIIRSDSPSRLTPTGWSDLYAYGIRTIITLRTQGIQENELDYFSPYSDIDTVQVHIEDITDEDFLRQWVVSELWGTPLYYKDAIHRWPERHTAVLTAIARAQPGGVLFHCIRGYDRTGIITLLLLALVGAEPDEIIADYELSPDPERDEELARRDTSVREVLLGALDGLDLEDYFVRGGASQADVAAVRRKLLG